MDLRMLWRLIRCHGKYVILVKIPLRGNISEVNQKSTIDSIQIYGKECLENRKSSPTSPYFTFFPCTQGFRSRIGNGISSKIQHIDLILTNDRKFQPKKKQQTTKS